jgi:hypothetical protein
MEKHHLPIQIAHLQLERALLVHNMGFGYWIFNKMVLVGSKGV